MKNLLLLLIPILLSSCSMYKIHKDGGYGKPIYPQDIVDVNNTDTIKVDNTKYTLMVNYMYDSK